MFIRPEYSARTVISYCVTVVIMRSGRSVG